MSFEGKCVAALSDSSSDGGVASKAQLHETILRHVREYPDVADT